MESILMQENETEPEKHLKSSRAEIYEYIYREYPFYNANNCKLIDDVLKEKYFDYDDVSNLWSCKLDVLGEEIDKQRSDLFVKQIE